MLALAASVAAGLVYTLPEKGCTSMSQKPLQANNTCLVCFPCAELPSEPGDQKLLGLYRQVQEGMWLQRVKVPGGRLDGLQWRALASVAGRFTPNTPLHLTTRQDVEIHDLTPDDIPAVQVELSAAGLTCLGAAGDTYRNITVCPCGGAIAGRSALPLGPTGFFFGSFQGVDRNPVHPQIAQIGNRRGEHRGPICGNLRVFFRDPAPSPDGVVCCGPVATAPFADSGRAVRRAVAQHLAHRGDDLIVDPPAGRDDPAVLLELTAVCEIERAAVDVAHAPAGFDHHQRAGGVVPDLLTVVRTRGEPQVDVCFASGDGRVLGLAVHPQRWRADAQPFGHAGGVAVAGVP